MFNLFAATPQLWGMNGQELVETATSIATCLGILAAALEVAAGRLVKQYREVRLELHAAGQDELAKAKAEVEALRSELTSLREILAERHEASLAGQKYVERLIEELKATRQGQCPRAVDGVARCCLETALGVTVEAAVEAVAVAARQPGVPGPEAAR